MQSSSNEPTLTNVIEKLDSLSTTVSQLATTVRQLSTDVETLSTDSKRFDERFADYRQATQWMVQLAFTLIASATITVILSTVLRK
jgi:outer membrane murein-binding lipoprotein Lpp